MQCGIACLQMICGHYGKKVTSDFLANYCFATTEGISMLGISLAAEQLGLKNVAGKLDAEELSKTTLPCILHWNQNHFVVLYKVRTTHAGMRFYIADPAKGNCHMVKGVYVTLGRTKARGYKRVRPRTLWYSSFS